MGTGAAVVMFEARVVLELSSAATVVELESVAFCELTDKINEERIVQMVS